VRGNLVDEAKGEDVMEEDHAGFVTGVGQIAVKY